MDKRTDDDENITKSMRHIDNRLERDIVYLEYKANRLEAENTELQIKLEKQAFGYEKIIKYLKTKGSTVLAHFERQLMLCKEQRDIEIDCHVDGQEESNRLCEGFYHGPEVIDIIARYDAELEALK